MLLAPPFIVEASEVDAIIERLGNSTILYIETAVGQLIVEGEGDLDAKSGQTVGLRLNQSHARLFGATGATL